MADCSIVELVSSDLEALMERFFSYSRNDLSRMQFALATNDFDLLCSLGHRAKGTGYSYGLIGMGDIGLELEDAARAKNEAEVRILVDRMTYYLENVKVEFGE